MEMLIIMTLINQSDKYVNGEFLDTRKFRGRVEGDGTESLGTANVRSWEENVSSFSSPLFN